MECVKKIYDKKQTRIFVKRINEKKALKSVFFHLRRFNWTLSSAESCTGGMFASSIVAKSGASEIFKGGIIAYSNEAKKNLLRVSESTLDEYGAVSFESVIEMSINCSKIFETDVSIAISGIAGPLGGSDEKPVGTVYIAIKSRRIFNCYRFHFSGNRKRIRINTVRASLSLLSQILKEEAKNEQ